jgi:hypothetical protein
MGKMKWLWPKEKEFLMKEFLVLDFIMEEQVILILLLLEMLYLKNNSSNLFRALYKNLD